MTTMSVRSIRSINAHCRRECVDRARQDAARRYGRVKWEVRSTPIDDESPWDGTTWNLLQLAQRGKAGRRYAVDAFKHGQELPVATYEIVMPWAECAAGIVFIQTMKVVDGITTFGWCEISPRQETLT